MRIVHVTPYYHPSVGGAQAYIKELSERLALKGHDITVLTQRRLTSCEAWDKRCVKDYEVINHVKVKRLKSREFISGAINKFLRIRGSYRILRLFHCLDHIQMLAYEPLVLGVLTDPIYRTADIVTVMDWRSAAFPYLVCKRRRITKFALVGIPLFHTNEPFSQSSVYPKLLSRCDAVCVSTDHEKDFVVQKTPSLERIYVLGPGVDPASFVNREGHRIRLQYGIGTNPVVGYVGRIAASKGISELIDAMKLIWRRNHEVRLVLAGSLPRRGNLDPEIDKALSGLSPFEKSRVINLGVFDEKEKASIFDALDIFAMPSRAESFGMSYLEAWMCKKPVIGPRLGSVECVIREGIDGLLVDPNDPTDIANAILTLLKDPEKRERMGHSGYLKTLDRFTWDAITDKLERIYSDLLEAPAVPLLQKNTFSASRQASSSPEVPAE